MINNPLEISGLSKSFQGIHALTDFSCQLRDSEILGLIGPNGAGKTTLFNLVSGFIDPEAGKVIKNGNDITGFPPYQIARAGISRTFQNLRLIRQISVLENVMLSFQDQAGENLCNVCCRLKKISQEEATNQENALAILEEAGLIDKASDSAENLSYGQQKLLSLACCLASKAEVLLLDEPVAGIAPEMIDKVLTMIHELPSKGKSVILIEHNIEAITRVCHRAIFMDAGLNVCEGTPEDVRNDPRVIEAYLD
jgi:ABC-type branched-subunit amino acid transport system ATPase component